MIRVDTPELSAAQRAAFEEQHRARGQSPIGMHVSADEQGVRNVLWTCDLWPFDLQEQVNLRGRLATLSFYADVSDQRYAHGMRSDANPGGRNATDALIAALQQSAQRVTQ